jgi:hypothetical protein
LLILLFGLTFEIKTKNDALTLFKILDILGIIYKYPVKYHYSVPLAKMSIILDEITRETSAIMDIIISLVSS